MLTAYNMILLTRDIGQFVSFKLTKPKSYLLFFSWAVDEGVSGVRGSDLADLLGDFVGDPAVDLLSPSLDLLVGDSATPFVVDAYLEQFSKFSSKKQIILLIRGMVYKKWRKEQRN